MSRWWRAYDDAVDDPKIQRLPDALFKAWFNLLCLASRNGGALPSLEDISFSLRKPLRAVEMIVVALRERGLIDEIEGELKPHNWNARQFQSDVSTERVQAFRKRQRNVSATANETPPDTEQRQSRTDIHPSLRSDDDWPKDFREQFWNAYPRRIGKKAAFRKLEAIRKAGECSFARLMAAIGRIEASAPNYIPHPTSWLNQGRYLDTETVDAGISDSEQQAAQAILDRQRSGAANGESRRSSDAAELPGDFGEVSESHEKPEGWEAARH